MWVKFMSWDYGALVFAIFWLAAIFFVVRWLFRREKSLARLVGFIAAGFAGVIGLILFAGSIAFQFGSRSEMASIERPGIMVDVGGYEIHIACAGMSDSDDPTVIWIPGGHSPGLSMNHLHKAWQTDGRSCIIDRAGAGWSDPGPEPRSIKAIVTEFDKALSGSGEAGPFIVVGHSLGGLVGVNWAARNTEDIVGLVALDPTPQEMIQTSGIQHEGGWCGAPSPGLQMSLSGFGIGHLVPSLHPMNSSFYRELHAELEDEILALKAMESRPRAILEGAKHYEVLCYSGYQTVRHPGALGDLPILSIVQPLKFDDEARAFAEQWSGVSDDFEWEVFKTSSEIAANEYPSFSSKGELKFLPGDWGHNFHLTNSDYVLENVKSFVAALGEASLETAQETSLPIEEEAVDTGEPVAPSE